MRDILVWVLVGIATHLSAQEGKSLGEGSSRSETLLNQSNLYELDLAIGYHYLIRLQQEGRDLVLSLRRPKGDVVLTVNGPFGKWGPEQIFLKVDGPYLLEIKPKSRTNSHIPSSYEVQIERLAEAPSEAEITLMKAWEFYFAKNWCSASERIQTALAIGQELDVYTRAGALYGLGNCSRRMAQPTQALSDYHSALELWLMLANEFQTARTHSAIGTTYQALGNHREALPYYESALIGFMRWGDLSWQATVGANIGHIYDVMGEPELAITLYRTALENLRAAGDRRREAWLLNNMGALARRMGAWQDARDHYQKAITILTTNGDRRWQARTLNSLGFLYLNLGQTDKAQRHFEDALPLRREVGDKRGEAITLANLGVVKKLAGHLQAALSHYKAALQLQQDTHDRAGQAKTLARMGKVVWQLKDEDQAILYYQRALALFTAVEDRRLIANIQSQLGAVYLAKGDLPLAATYLESAQRLQETLGYPVDQVETLRLQARLARLQGHLHRSHGLLISAIHIVENQRTRIASIEMRISWFAAVEGCYKQLVTVLMALQAEKPETDYAIQALLICEQARARGLLEFLLESELQPHRNTPLLQERNRLIHKLSARSAAQLTLLSHPHEESERLAAEIKVQETLIALDSLDSRIRLANPRLPQWSKPLAMDGTQIKKLVDPESLILVYDLGDERSFLWLVKPAGIEAFPLPARATIEKATRTYLSQLSLINPSAYAAQKQAAADLSEILLGPIADQLSNHRLAIVADGALHNLPFAALPKPNGGRPLLIEHELVMLPSLSVLVLARKRARGFEIKNIAFFADPVYQPTDPRLMVTPNTQKQPSKLTRFGDNPLSLTRLSGSRSEVLGIAEMTEAPMLALDFEASRATVLSGELQAYDALHFATHGLINDLHPELSGLVLSLYDASGQAIPGVLSLPDIINLGLDTELVVLSGCSTAWGKDIRGEGILGLARGFLQAGARRMIASHWRVEDRATTRLMQLFYSAMLQKGMSPSSALRHAQLTLRHDRRYRDPWYWSAFTIHGDWR